MSPLIFIVRRSLVNIVKGLIKKPAMLALYVLAALSFVAMIVFMFTIPGNINHGDTKLFTSIVTALTIVVYYLSLKQGLEKGSSMFRASDINFIFAGPFRPNSALLYGFVKQLGGMLLIVFVAVFQIPNLRNNFPLEPWGVWVVLLAVAIYALSYPIFGMVVYAYASKSALRKRTVSTLLNVAMIAVILVYLYQLYTTQNALTALDTTFNSAAVGWIPVVGWMRDIAAAAVGDIGFMFWMGLGLMLATVAAFVFILYKLNLDYYEEVLAATDFREAAIAAKKEGRNIHFESKARRKVRRPVFGRGAAALFGKTILEMRKSAFLLFFDSTSVVVIFSALIFKFILPKELNPYAMLLVLSFGVYMLFLLQMQGRWPAELSRHFIFTLPARAPEKLFFVTAADHIKNLLDGAALFIIAGVMLKAMNVYEAIPFALIAVCVFAYVFLGAVFVYTDVLARRLFGSVHSKSLVIFLKFFLTVFILSPGIVVMIVAGFLTHSEIIAAAVFALWAFLAAFGVFAGAWGIFKNIEASA